MLQCNSSIAGDNDRSYNVVQLPPLCGFSQLSRGRLTPLSIDSKFWVS